MLKKNGVKGKSKPPEKRIKKAKVPALGFKRGECNPEHKQEVL